MGNTGLDVGRPGIAGCPGLGAGRLSFSGAEPCSSTGTASRGLLERGANAKLLHLRGGTEGGEIDIAAVYVAPGDGPLYIFLSQTEPMGSGAISYLRTKTYEYLETVESWHPSGPGIKCFDHTGDERRSCFDNVEPVSCVCMRISLDVGGVEARRTKIGSNTGSDSETPAPRLHPPMSACDFTTLPRIIRGLEAGTKFR